MKLLPILLAPSIASAAVTIDWVTVGDPGNAADSTGYGAVGYEYQIGKYEVTNAQYAGFLNAADPNGTNANGIYNSFMGSDVRGGISFNTGGAIGSKYSVKTHMGNKPVNYVSWYDAARFANWLHNGQGSGSTETGAYTLNGNTGIISKNVGATVWIPTENEWYKAAYYDPTPGAGGGDNYWHHATQSDSAPTVATANATGEVSNPGANVANYNSGADWNAQNGNSTTVGSATANSYFGTADQAGNVWEWNDLVIASLRGLRGGSWISSSSNSLAASTRSDGIPIIENSTIGFRLATIPEPSAFILSILFSSILANRRKR